MTTPINDNNQNIPSTGPDTSAAVQDSSTQHTPTQHGPAAQAPGPVPAPPGDASAGRSPEAAAAAPVRRRGLLVPVATTAVAAAVLASLGTAAFTGQLGSDDSASGASESSVFGTLGQKSDSSVNVPVASSSEKDPDWQAVSSAVAPSVVAIQVTTESGSGEGSGVIIDGEGHILTNNHVVEGAVDDTVQVTLSDGRIYEATITGLDPATDLAVVQLVDAPDDLSSAVFGDSDDAVVGEPVMAMGNPLGLSHTATTGIISAIDRPVSTATASGDGTPVVTNALQIDAAINPGNSGGPLFNASGEVIGITSSIATLSSGSSQSGSIGLGFAIPVNLAQNIGDQLITNGSAEHAFLGVSLTDGTGTADGTTRQGAVVKDVTASSPAADADLQVDDVIVAIDGEPVTGSQSLTGFVRALPSGTEVTLTVVRDGKALDVPVTLATKPESATSSGGSSGQTPAPDQDGSGNGSQRDGSQGKGSQGNGSQGNGSQDPTDPGSIPNLPDLGDLFPHQG